MATAVKIIDDVYEKIDVFETIWIEMSDGCNLAARVWLPKDANTNPVPAILEYLPYRRRDGTIERDELTHPYFAANGYACIRVDMRGTGDSDGLMYDEYLLQEQDDCIEVIEWLCKQEWCDSNVGMMGISWGGFNGLQVAARQPEALKAVVTICSTDDRYADDIHYKGGALLGENLGWASTMFSYQTRPPDPEVVGDRWKDMWLQRLEKMPLLVKTWLEHPTYDSYWKHGSICENYNSVKAAVLAVGGWSDAYHNTVFRMAEHLNCPFKAIVGPWAHKYPHFAVPEPKMAFLQEALRWWDMWLKGVDTGIMSEPKLRIYELDSYKAKTSHPELKGKWVAANEWPSTKVSTESFYLNATKQLLKTKASTSQNEEIIVNSPEDTGSTSGEFCIIWLGADWPPDQREDDGKSEHFDILLDDDLHILGAPIINLKLRSKTAAPHLTARICDVHPDGQSTRITYGVLNLSQHKNREAPEALEENISYDVSIKLDDCAYRLPKGHKLRLSLSTAYWPLIWAASEKSEIRLELQNCHLLIPKLNDTTEFNPNFPQVESAPLADIDMLRPSSQKRTVHKDLSTGESTFEIYDDFGLQHIKRFNLNSEEICHERYTIHPDDPTSAKAEISWKEGLSRDDWNIETETTTRMTADKDFFYIEATCIAKENDGVVFRKSWIEKVERKLL